MITIFDLLKLEVAPLGLSQRMIETLRLGFNEFVKRFASCRFYLISQSPSPQQTVTARVLHPHHHAIAPCVIDFNPRAMVEPLAPPVFQIAFDAIEKI
jgi:hypothetical protein